jgi:Family of unknown function (DUF6295)
VCTYQTEKISLEGSAKTPTGWTSMTDATVYFDHPVHYPAGHALMIDVLSPAHGPSARVALELSAESARALANAILQTLDTVPSGLLSDTHS